MNELTTEEKEAAIIHMICGGSLGDFESREQRADMLYQLFLENGTPVSLQMRRIDVDDLASDAEIPAMAGLVPDDVSAIDGTADLEGIDGPPRHRVEGDALRTGPEAPLSAVGIVEKYLGGRGLLLLRSMSKAHTETELAALCSDLTDFQASLLCVAGVVEETWKLAAMADCDQSIDLQRMFAWCVDEVNRGHGVGHHMTSGETDD